MSPDEATRMPCPWSHCLGIVRTLRHAPSSDHLDELVTTVEQHEIVGPDSWYQRWCPGSHLLVPLSDRGREVLADADARFLAALAERMSRQLPPADLAAENAAIEERHRRGELGHLDGDPQTYFPPRPSDVEEVEGRPVPEGVELHAYDKRRRGRNQGRDIPMTSANETTISLANLAKQGITNGQEDCSRATNVVDLVKTALIGIDQHLENAAQLIEAAASSGSARPVAADAAAAALATARVRLDEAAARTNSVTAKIAEVFAAAHQSIEKLDEFIEQISR